MMSLIQGRYHKISFSSILVYHFLLCAQHFCSTWMTSQIHFEKKKGFVIQDRYFGEGMENNSAGEKVKKERKDKILFIRGYQGCFYQGLLGYKGFQGFWQAFGLSARPNLGVVFFSRLALSFGSGTDRSKYFSLDTPK